jgi:membrane-associated phospholipid phosphatase
MNYWKYHHPRHNVFTWLMILLTITGAVLLYNIHKDTLFWQLNQRHSYPGDLFFAYFTHVGDGLVMLALGIVLLGLGKRKLGVMLFLSFILSGLIVQISKRSIPEPRPGRYFPQINAIHKVNDMPLTGNNSFPSGHTTTAFAMFSMLALTSRYRRLQMGYFLLALLVGYSRIYLGHHFFKDVYVGAIVGYLSSLMTLWIFRNKMLYNDRV